MSSQVICRRDSDSLLLKQQLMAKKRKATASPPDAPEAKRLVKNLTVLQLQQLATQAYLYGDLKSGEAWLNQIYKVTGDLDKTMRFKAFLQESLVKDVVSSARKMQKRMVYSKMVDDEDSSSMLSLW